MAALDTCASSIVYKGHMCNSELASLQVTTPDDMSIAERFLSESRQPAAVASAAA
jgi:hypothetical protein